MPGTVGRVSSSRTASAVAPSNIALVKYWGKRDIDLNLPATGSISVTLDTLRTFTTVTFDESLAADEFVLGGEPAPEAGRRVGRFLDLVRSLHGVAEHARVETRNDFPTGAGLASSASGFAALAVACNAALDLGLTTEQLSVLARRGSGSAARSLIGGFAEMHPGSATDGSDAHAVPLAPVDQLPLRVLVAVTTRAAKSVGSGEGMRRTEATSPFYGAWIDATRSDLDTLRTALGEGDLEAVGTIAEGNCLRMHATMLGAEPGLLYWNAATVSVIHAVRALRAEGLGAWFTIDAGPQVKVLCDAADEAAVHERLQAIEGVQDILAAGPGAGAHVDESHA
jgi:diphosphomevalonate decarboxylase